VTMGTHEDAAQAIDHLDSKFVWEGMGSPMVVKWMDAALQRRRREQHLAAMRQGLLPNMAIGKYHAAPSFNFYRISCSISLHAPGFGQHGLNSFCLFYPVQAMMLGCLRALAWHQRLLVLT
jgi:hypothetical protein